VEGGAKTLQYFLLQKHWHRCYAFIAPMILGQGLSYSSEISLVSMNEKLLLQHSKSMNLQNDILLTGKREIL
jgi:riboflavin biosynthesis pyrimidine reductase